MRRPLLCSGTEAACLTIEQAPAQARMLRLDEADAAFFRVGDPLFVHHPDDATLESPGVVSSIDAGALSLSLPVRETTTPGSSVWRPASWFAWPSEPDLPIERRYESGVRVERSMAGVFFATQVAEPLEIVRLRCGCMPHAQLQALCAWIGGAIQSGLLEFALVDERGVVNRARLVPPDWEARRVDEQLAELTLELAILAEGEYAP